MGHGILGDRALVHFWTNSLWWVKLLGMTALKQDRRSFDYGRRGDLRSG